MGRVYISKNLKKEKTFININGQEINNPFEYIQNAGIDLGRNTRTSENKQGNEKSEKKD